MYYLLAIGSLRLGSSDWNKTIRIDDILEVLELDESVGVLGLLISLLWKKLFTLTLDYI